MCRFDTYEQNGYDPELLETDELIEKYPDRFVLLYGGYEA